MIIDTLIRYKTRLSIVLLWIVVCILTSEALIVYKGEIVSEWPDQNFSSGLGKTRSSENGMGFYPNPSGKVYALTFLVDFSDQPALFTVDEVRDWLNQPGFNRDGCNGSVRDYFLDVSNGKVDLKNEVFGYYRAMHPKSYYESGPGYSKASELVDEVMAYFDNVVDFSRYDNSGDGKTESISIVYAGNAEVWGQGIWPHAGWMDQTRDATKLTRYMMTNLADKFHLYLFVHEIGHMIFGWPDLYWFGDYCVMGNRINDRNPVAVNDFFRADQGWIDVTDLTNANDAVLYADVEGAGFTYFNPTNPLEGFFWSNINNSGRWSALKGGGILVYHFDLSKKRNSGPDNLCLRVVQADNTQSLTDEKWPKPGSNASHFFYSTHNDKFTTQSTPNSQWYDRTAHLNIYNIGPKGDRIHFTFKNTPSTETAYLPVATVTVQHESCGSSDGKIHFTFSNRPDRTNIRFSKDGGVAFDLNAALKDGSATFNNLAPGVYNIWARWGNGDFPVKLGDYTVKADPVPDLEVAVTDATTQDDADGKIEFTFSAVQGNRTHISFSKDNGQSYPLTVELSQTRASFDNLYAGKYDLWARWGNTECPLSLGVHSIDVQSSTSLLPAEYALTSKRVTSSLGTISYALPHDSKVSAAIYTLSGKQIWSSQAEMRSAGHHTMQIPSPCTSTLYLLVFRAGNIVLRERLLVAH